MYNEIVERIKKEKQSIDWNAIHTKEISIKRIIYTIVITYSILDFEEQIELLLKEKDHACKVILFKNNLQKYSIEQLDYFLDNKNNYIRFYALEEKYGRLQEEFKDITKYLFDKSIRIREFAIYILKKQGYSQKDIMQYYINKVYEKNNEVAIVAVGQQGTSEHITLLLPFLVSEDVKIKKATIKALGLLNYHDTGLYWNYLCDTNVSLSKAAFDAIIKNRIRYGSEKLYALFISAKEEHIRNYALKLLVEEDSWDRLPYLLKLYNCEDKAKRNVIQRKAHHRNYYKKISKEEAENIRNVILQIKLPETLIREILFDLRFIVQE